MRLSLFYTVFILIEHGLLAQPREMGPPANANAIANNLGAGAIITLPLKLTYRYPFFKDGVVVFRNNEEVGMQLNYNVANDQVHFKNEKGDTLSLQDPLTVNYVKIDKDFFYFNKGRWLQTIETKAGITLAYSQEIRILLTKYARAYDNTVLSVEKLRNSDYLNSDKQRINFIYGNMEGIIYITKYFYFGDVYGNFFKANKHHLLDFFEKEQTAVKEFINTHRTNFDKLNDLHSVLEFCDTLE